MWYRLLGLRPDIMDDDEHLRSILLGEINSVLRYSVQLDHDIMELEARREALRVETLKMNDVLQQPANLYYLHPKHYKPFETEGGKITPLRNGRYRATKLFQQVRSNETFDTKAECEKWLNIAILDEQERVNKTGGRQLCCVCNLNIGSTIKCKYPHCRKRFHATCARKNNFTLNITIEKNGLEWNAFCPAHSKP